MERLSLLKDTYRSRHNDLQRRTGVRDELLEKLTPLLKKNKTVTEKITLIEKALTFVEETLKVGRQDVLKSIETVVNESLRYVYLENAPSLEFEVSVKRDRSAIVPYFLRTLEDGRVLKREPEEGWGYGVSDIAALMLRMILIKASGAEAVIVADEPFKNLGVKQVPRASLLLRELCHRLGVQVIMTTHHEATVECADKSFSLFLEGSEAKVI